jgi:hypothetical protein
MNKLIKKTRKFHSFSFIFLIDKMYDESKNKSCNISHQNKNKSNESVKKISMCVIDLGYYIYHNFH